MPANARSRWTPGLLAGALLAMLTASARVDADTLTLTDGTVVKGRVRIETSVHVYFEELLDVGDADSSPGTTRERDREDSHATRLRVFASSQIRSLDRSKTLSPKKLSPKTLSPKTLSLKGPRTDPSDENSPSDATTAPATADASAETVAKYYRIPLEGTVGREFSASAIRAALAEAPEDPDLILVLEIQSPGGLVSECERIVELLSTIRERRTIAYVVEALSAAAVIALACDEIYLHENATIGGAVAFRESFLGATVVDEKFNSIWRATCRRAAEIGGHDPLFAEAMMDPDLHLRVVSDRDGRPRLEPVPDERVAEVLPDEIVTRRGKILTATALEAERYGLAAGVVKELAEIPLVAPGMSSWKSVSTRGERSLAQAKLRVERVIPRLEKALDEAFDALDLAVEFDPTRRTYRRTRDGSIASVDREIWISYSKACYDQLGRAEKAFREAGRLGEGHPFLEALTAAVLERETQMAEIRERIKEGARQNRD